MDTTTPTPIADTVASFDSHGIYDVAKIVTPQLRNAGYGGLIPQGMTHKETWRAIEGRGLGGSLAPEEYPGQRLVGGYMIASAVCHTLVGRCLGDQLFGRGSAHRAHVEAIRNWERVEAPKLADDE